MHPVAGQSEHPCRQLPDAQHIQRNDPPADKIGSEPSPRQGENEQCETHSTGAGKTWIACALANQACRQHHSVLYRRMPELVEEFAAIRGTGAHARLMRRLKRVDLLVLDDWGLQPFAPESRRDIFEIVEFRERRASLLVAGQVPPDHWHGVIGEGTIADAMLDRMVHYAYRIDLAGESMRRRAEPPDLAKDVSA